MLKVLKTCTVVLKFSTYNLSLMCAWHTHRDAVRKFSASRWSVCFEFTLDNKLLRLISRSTVSFSLFLMLVWW